MESKDRWDPSDKIGNLRLRSNKEERRNREETERWGRKETQLRLDMTRGDGGIGVRSHPSPERPRVVDDPNSVSSYFYFNIVRRKSYVRIS